MTMRPDRGVDGRVNRARAGDRAALEALVRDVQGDVYGLALRFLWHPQDAEDATQEILVRVVKGLSGFRGDSRFRTWVYHIACNTLLGLRRQRMERPTMSFEVFGEDLARGLSDDPSPVAPDVDHRLLLEEVKIGCTLAMLLCLDRDHRIAYVLGEILELDHQEAAEVLEITPAAFRKRLSRARAGVNAFMAARCGLVNRSNACRCRRRVATAVRLGRVDPARLLFASSLGQAKRFPRVVARIRRLEATRRAAALYRSHPDPKPSGSFVSWLRNAIDVQPGGTRGKGRS
jgi:RNA polymerase sigma factor (sigma-70 family)